MPTVRSSRLFSGALAMLFACALHLPLGAQPLAREVARFTERLNAWGEMPGESQTGARAAWDAMDSLVVAALNGGVAPTRLDSLLATVPGYSGASEGEGVRVGRTAFYSQLPRETPGYFVAPVRVGARTLLLGVYSLTMNAPGRMSVYAERAGRWSRVGRFDGRHPIAPYLLPLADGVLGVVTVEKFVGGDHAKGYVKLWRLTPAGLRLERAEPGWLLDPRREMRDGALVVESDSFPPAIGGAFLGPRMVYRTTYRAAGGRFVRERVEANPWLHVVERFYALLERGRRTEARALAADDAVFRALAAVRASVQEEGGDAARGEGWLRMRAEDGAPVRIESRRAPDGRWRIVRVTREERAPGN